MDIEWWGGLQKRREERRQDRKERGKEESEQRGTENIDSLQHVSLSPYIYSLTFGDVSSRIILKPIQNAMNVMTIMSGS